LRRRGVELKLQISTSTIYSKLKFNPKRPHDFDPTFPKPVKLGKKAVGWIEAELDTWLTMRST
jgi:prophage regulatory protein